MAQGKKVLTPEEIKQEAALMEQIEVLSGMNCSHAEISAVVKIPERTLRRKYGRVIDAGRLNGKASLKRKMWQCAMGRIERKTVLVKVKRETRKPDGTIEKYETQEPRTIDHYVEANAGMMQWLSKQMLGYKDVVQHDGDVPGESNQSVTINWVLKGPDGKNIPTSSEEIAKAYAGVYDQGG